MPIGLRFDLGNSGLGVLATISSIILIDIVLSGDNALVIGAAASRLPRAQRWIALIWGGVGAIVLRVVLAALTTFLLLIPLLQAIGGVILMVIAIRLLLPQDDGAHINAKDQFFPAVLTILAADVTMSLDNIIAIGALAKGDVTILAIGLLVSMAVLFLASALIARIIERLSILLDLASLVLAFTAANLVASDPFAKPYVGQLSVAGFSGSDVLHVAFVAIIVLVDIALRLWVARRGGAAAGNAQTAVASTSSDTPVGAALNGGSPYGAPNGAPMTDATDAPSGSNGSVNGKRQAVGETAETREPVTSRPLGSHAQAGSEATDETLGASTQDAQLPS